MTTFKIDNDWTPTKVYELDSYMVELIETTKKLEAGQSIPLSVRELKKKYGWKSATSCCSSLRHALNKRISDRFMAKISLHEVKGLKGSVRHIRIRRKSE